MSAISMMQEEEMLRVEGPDEGGFGCLETTLGNLPVKALDVRATITGLVYEVTMRQSYVNRFEEPLEATYMFPLPDRGAVRDFRMIVGERTIEGVLKERGEARRDYEEAIEAGHRASIVEEERPDTFTMRVGNVAPGEEVTIEFKVTGPLLFADGEATFRFPLVVAPRYIPGSPLTGGDVGDGIAADTDAVPDASRITPPVLLPGFPNPIQLSITVDIAESALGVSNIRSSLHAITVESEGGRRIAIAPGERVNRDFILRFDTAGEGIESTMSFVRDAEGDEGTFLVTVVPPADAAAATLPRDVVFVLDRSGSMGGWKMVAARRALGRMLDTLTPRDRFEVFVFDNVLRKFGDGLRSATNRNRWRAIEELGQVEARGGTEMAEPIFEALDLLAGGYEDRRRLVVLVTDGQVGNEDQILRGAAGRQKNAQIFTVGIDRAVNAGFLNRLADLGGGRCELVESEERLDEAMDRVHRTIDNPVLTGLNLSLEAVECLRADLVPNRPPDLFAGAPVLLMGRFRGAGTPVAKLAATRPDGSSWSSSERGMETGDTAATAIWARQRVRAMEDDYATRRVGPESITKLSLRFGVLCRFTSWVAIDREARVEVGESLRQIVQPVESPDGWMPGGGPPAMFSAGAAFSPQAPPPPSSPRMRSRAEAEASIEPVMAFSPMRSARADEMPETTALPIVKVQGRPAWPGYLSPEEVRGSSPDERSRVFVLGAIAFELITGRRLFEEPSSGETRQAILDWDRSVLRSEPSITSAWFDVLHKALAPDPNERHANPQELLEALRQCEGGDVHFGGFPTSAVEAWMTRFLQGGTARRVEFWK